MQRQRRGILPSVFRGGSRHVVKLYFPANTLFIRLNGNDFACVPLLVNTHFNQQTLICEENTKNKRKVEMIILHVLISSCMCDRCSGKAVHHLTFLSIFSVVLFIVLRGLPRRL